MTKLNDLYAHRGFHDKPTIPENSLPAFKRAVEHGFGSEFDVHMIADGTLVVFHDDDLERETGEVGRIADYTFDELKYLRLEGSNEYIPTFDEVLKVYEDNPGPDGKPYPLLIELKVDRDNYKELVKKVCDRLDSYPGEFVIESFDPRAVYELKKTRPEICRGQLVQNFISHDLDRPKVQSAFLTEMPYRFITKPDFVAFRFADKDLPAIKRAMKGKDIGKAAWTIRTPKAYKAARKLGCSVIFEKFNPHEVEL